MQAEEKHLDFLYRWARYRNWFDLERALLSLGCRKLAIYGSGLPGALLFEALAEGAIQIAYVVKQKSDPAFPYPARTVTPEAAAEMEPVDAVIVACYDSARVCDAIARSGVRAGKIMMLFDLLVDIDQFLLFERILRHVEAQGAKLYLCDLTNPLYHKNPSLFEAIARNADGSHLWEDTMPGHLESYYDDLADRPEGYAKAVFFPPEMTEIITRDGATLLNDVHSAYYNIVNHCRVTTDTPERYDHTIHFFGNCVALGCFAEDGYTIESQLQRRLRRDPPGGAVFRVVNRANLAYGEKAYRPLLHTRFQAGDIVALICSRLRPIAYAFQNLRYLDLVPAFDRPHKYGDKEVFFDRYHINHRGYDLLADYLYDRLFCKEDLAQGAASPRVPAKLRIRPDQAGAPRVQHAEKDGLAQYQDYLRAEQAAAGGCIGSIVMNANPFSLGHRYLVEKALEQCDFLYLFVVEEDRSEFPFADRIAMVREGTADLTRVKVLRGGRYIISSQTLPEYFLKGDRDITIDATYDLQTFAEAVCPVLGITKRFVGNEPICAVTRQYNEAMQEILPKYGVNVIEFPRKEAEGEPISASRIRAALREGRRGDLCALAPATTLSHLAKQG